MPPFEYASPRMEVHDLALFMVSSELARLGVIKRAKFPKPAPLGRYKELRAAVMAYLLDEDRSPETLAAAERSFTQMAADASQGGSHQSDAQFALKALGALQGMKSEFEGIEFSPAPSEQPPLAFNGVEIPIRFDLLTQATNGTVDQIGAAILRVSEETGEFDVTRLQRKELGIYVATIIRVHIERNIVPERQIASRLCMSIGVPHGEVLTAPGAIARRIADVESACRFIRAIWPTIT